MAFSFTDSQKRHLMGLNKIPESQLSVLSDDDFQRFADNFGGVDNIQFPGGTVPVRLPGSTGGGSIATPDTDGGQSGPGGFQPGAGGSGPTLLPFPGGGTPPPQFQLFQGAFNTNLGDPGFLPFFDFDRSGAIDFTDFLNFSGRFSQDPNSVFDFGGDRPGNTVVQPDGGSQAPGGLGFGVDDIVQALLPHLGGGGGSPLDVEGILGSISSSLGQLAGRDIAGGLDPRFSGIESLISGLDSRFGNIEGLVGGLNPRFGNIESLIGGLDPRLTELQNAIGDLDTGTLGFGVDDIVQALLPHLGGGGSGDVTVENIFSDPAGGGLDQLFNQLFAITDPLVSGYGAGPFVPGEPLTDNITRARQKILSQTLGIPNLFDVALDPAGASEVIPPNSGANIGGLGAGANVTGVGGEGSFADALNFPGLGEDFESGETPTETFDPSALGLDSLPGIVDERQPIQQALLDQVFGNTGAQDLIGGDLISALDAPNPFSNIQGSPLEEVLNRINRQADIGRERLINRFGVINKLDQPVFHEDLQSFEGNVLDTLGQAITGFGLEEARAAEPTRRGRLADLTGFNQQTIGNLADAFTQAQGAFQTDIGLQDQAVNNALQRFIDITSFNNAAGASRAGFGDQGLNMALSFLSGAPAPGGAGTQAASIFGNLATQNQNANNLQQSELNNLINLLVNRG